MNDQPAETAVTPHADGQTADEQPNGVPGDTDRTESVQETLARLYADGRAYAAAEAERQKLRVGIVGRAVRNAAILAAIALMLLFASIVALLVGLTFALAHHMAPIWATLTVMGGGLVVALLLLLAARACITRMKKAIAP